MPAALLLETDDEVQLNDVGTKVLVQVTEFVDVAGKLKEQPVDISDATLKEITIEPLDDNSESVTRAASFETDGSDGLIFILSIAGDFDVAGKWSRQGYVETPGGNWRTKVKGFTVNYNLGS